MLSEIEDIHDQMEREKHLIKVLKLKINMKNWQSKIQVIQETQANRILNPKQFSSP